jgi:hypothetical protein
MPGEEHRVVCAGLPHHRLHIHGTPAHEFVTLPGSDSSQASSGYGDRRFWAEEQTRIALWLGMGRPP